jgi:hypothetical protein
MKRLSLVVLILGLLVAAPQTASRQSFLYVATPQVPCAGTPHPCPASEVLVYDSATGGLVTRIPLIPDSAEHALVFAPDGRSLYAFGNKGTTKIDTTTHTAINLPLGGTLSGTRYGPVAIRRDGARIYAVTRDPLAFSSLKTVDTATGAVANFSDPQQLGTSFIGGLAASPVADRLFVNSVKGGSPGGLYEYDTVTEQVVRTLVNAGGTFSGPLAISPDANRLYYAAPNSGARRIAVHDSSPGSALGLVGEFTEPITQKIFAGGRGRRVYSFAYTGTGVDTDYRIRIFDAVTLNPAAVAETVIVDANNLVASEDESRLFVGVRTTLSSDGAGSTVYRNRIDVLNALSALTIGTIALPDTSFHSPFGGSTTPDFTFAMVTTPADAPRCSYRVGTTQNAWTTAGGSTTIALTTPCTWVASSDAPWVRVSAAAGSGNATLTITVDPAVSGSARRATLTVAGQTVTISQAGFGSVAPFGSFDTPVEGAGGISGSLAVTGWALDDAGVTGVRIFRDPVPGEPGVVFLGNATLVEGARPDVVAAFPGFPLNTRAGWGLNVLTNMLPNQGNGTFRLYAYIDDIDGHTTILGPRTFTSSNTNSLLPFGAIDTPGQGETVSGTIVNFGWVLTPQPNSIPLDGSTIDVVIDGVVVGHPTYNNFRSDIAGLFPGLQNSNGAVGFFTVDTTQYDNGVHTIAWVVRDNAGNAAGIGSRYFRIQN